MSGYEHFEVAHHHTSQPEKWKRISAFATMVFALMIAVASFGIENANHHALLLKNEAIDNWSFFQAKSLKERMYDIEANTLSFTQKNDPLFNEKAYLVKQYKNEVDRYKKEQKEIIKKARYYTEQSESYDMKGNFYELAQVFFELAIVLNAIFLMSDRKIFFIGSSGTASLGAVFIFIGLFYFA
ncbi:DUF4337 family protein [Candidatus Peregrinibacteria bacterium]|jgi:hypothetical protein|nr:DUF4337 family protein [Candidatus Peregrinibacteria bacterium]